MITALKEHGYSNFDISNISGHKNPHSVDRYFRRRRDEDMEDMADSLHLEASTSASSVTVQRVTKKARIITISPSGLKPATASELHQEQTCVNSDVPAIHFNGRFENCTFNVLK